MTPSDTNFLALGDSYTIGEGVPPDQRWPVQVARALREKKLDVGDPLIIAQTGWTTDELSRAIDDARIEGRRFKLVTLLIGVNNQYRGKDVEEYRREFSALLARAVNFAGGESTRVVVVSIPDWGVTPFAKGRDRAKVAREIDEYNRVNREEATRAGTRYVDVTPPSRSRTDDVVADGLHPSGGMYADWAKLIEPEAAAALAGEGRR
jgi:lysophospholipase L1-like esterase